MNQIKIDMEEVAMLELQIKNAKKRLEEIKDLIRNNDIMTINNIYAIYSRSDQNTYGYTEEDQKKIDDFIQKNNIEKVLLTSKPGYKIAFKITKTGENKYKKVIKSAINNAQTNTIKKATLKLA